MKLLCKCHPMSSPWGELWKKTRFFDKDKFNKPQQRLPVPLCEAPRSPWRTPSQSGRPDKKALWCLSCVMAWEPFPYTWKKCKEPQNNQRANSCIETGLRRMRNTGISCALGWLAHENKCPLGRWKWINRWDSHTPEHALLWACHKFLACRYSGNDPFSHELLQLCH